MSSDAHFAKSVERELADLYQTDAAQLWTFERAWTTSGYGHLPGVTARHEQACKRAWTQQVGQWNSVNNLERGTTLPVLGSDNKVNDDEKEKAQEIATLGYCALSKLPASLVCFKDDDPLFLQAFQGLSREERKTINILWFYDHQTTVPLSGVDTLEDLTQFPIHPAAWNQHNMDRYNRACFLYTVILLKRAKAR